MSLLTALRHGISKLFEDGEVDAIASSTGMDLVGFDPGDSGLEAGTGGAALRELSEEIDDLNAQRLAAKDWAENGLHLWAPPHVGDVLTDVIVVWRGSAGTVTAGTLTLGKLVSGSYGTPTNQLAAASYNLAGLAVNTPTSLAGLLHATASNRTYASTALLQAEIANLNIGGDGFIALVPVFTRP